MRSIRGLSLLICLIALSGCSGIGEPLSIRVSVDCPVLGKKLLLAQDGKDWMLTHQDDMPGSVLEFTNAVGRHNQKTEEICSEKVVKP